MFIFMFIFVFILEIFEEEEWSCLILITLFDNFEVFDVLSVDNDIDVDSDTHVDDIGFNEGCISNFIILKSSILHVVRIT